MKYFINTGTLIIIGVVLALMCLGFLTTYIGNRKEIKIKKANLYNKNPYVIAHKQMIRDIKEYEDEIAGMEPDEIEKHKKKYAAPNTSIDLDEWENRK